MNKDFKKLELTVPAGGMDQLIAAVNAGADSVYLGYKKFGARAYADNFDLNQLKKAVAIAHSRNVKVYLTLNTLIKDSEVKEVLEFLKYYTAICTDGIIIQDFCLCKIIRDLFGHIPIHASTQVNIHNTYSLKLIKRLGFKRAILAREMTLDEIKSLCREKLTEIEIFIHGSQCYSYSGSCYFSSFISGRSGNRGRCPQPCRMKYKTVEEIDGKYKYNAAGERYILSKSDLCLLDFIPRMAMAGVDALKIEGRMKSAEYVGIVTKIYRKYIDLYYNNPLAYKVDEYDVYKLTQIFSRELGIGYIKDRYPPDIISLKKSGSIGNFLGRVFRVGYKNRSGKRIGSIHIKSRWEINRGDILEVWTKKGSSRIAVKDFEMLDNKNKVYTYVVKTDKTDDILEKDRVFKYFDKNLSDEAGALYKYGLNKNIPVIPGLKKHFSSVEEGKIKKYLNSFLSSQKQAGIEKSINKLTLAASVYNHKFIESSIKNGAKRIIFNKFDEFTDSKGFKGDIINLIKEFDKNKDITLCIGTPNVLYDCDFIQLESNISRLLDAGIRNFRVSNYGVLELLLELNKNSKSDVNINIYLSYNFNLFNTLSLAFLNGFIGKNEIFKGVEFSPELNLKEIYQIISNTEGLFKNNKPEFSIFGHGYIPVMSSRYKLRFITGKEEGRFYIEDAKGYRFPVTSDYNGNMIVFNSKNICTFYDLEEIKNNKISNLILDSRFYSEKDFCKILRNYREASEILNERGVKKYKSFASYLQNDNLFSNYSRGHLFRGVE